MSLEGQRVLVPRGGAAGERWSETIRRRGGVPRVVPMIETAPPLDPAPLFEAVSAWNRGDYEWAVVTSPRGAAAFVAAGALPHSRSRMAAVGPATTDELSSQGYLVDLVPSKDYSAAGLAAALLQAIPQPSSLLLPISEIADTVLQTALRAAGHSVDRVDAYRTVPAPEDPAAAAAVANGEVGILLASSGSVAREFARRFGPVPDSTLVIAMGEPTARCLREAGIVPDGIATTHTLDGMLDTAVRLLAARHTVAPVSVSHRD